MHPNRHRSIPVLQILPIYQDVTVVRRITFSRAISAHGHTYSSTCKIQALRNEQPRFLLNVTATANRASSPLCMSTWGMCMAATKPLLT